MLFAIGTRVRFRFTGESGTITALFEDGMLQVRLTDDPDLEIPAFEEDLVRDGDPVSPGAKFIAGKPAAPPPEPAPRREVKSQYVILKGKGIQLGFEPMPGRDGTVSKFKAWLINDTNQDVMADFRLFVRDELVLDLEEKLSAMTALDAGNILFDDLNDAPEVEFSCRRFSTAGLDEPVDKFLKIRAKQFFNNLLTAPVLNVQVHHYLLVEAASGEPKTSAPKADDLKTYTREKVREQNPGAQRRPNFSHVEQFSVEEFAHFEPEIDLHIHHLTNGYARMDKSMMLRMQLAHFQKFMDKAIRLGVPRVFIIHGIGEGKLRDAVAQRLRDFPEVSRFKNEFHAKYGYGATEVVFR